MNTTNSDPRPSNALALSEQAVHLLRRHGTTALAEYYIGSLPFVLGLLFFWSDMSRNPYAQWHIAPAAAGMALLFIWMKLWQVRFGHRLQRVLQGSPAPSWSMRGLLVAGARQAGLQATGWIILPVASLIVLPLGWVYAFYQNLTVMDGPDQQDSGTLVRKSMSQAALDPGQNHLLLAIMTLFGLMVLANIAVCLVILPQLLKRLFGVETVFTLGGIHLLNTTFIAVICALAYLCVDPLVKTAYVLRCYYGQARQSGEDIRSGLKPYLAATIIGLVFIAGLPVSISAKDTVLPTAGAIDAGQIHHQYVHQLDQAIDQVLAQRAFAWRMAREKPPTRSDKPSWLQKIGDWIIKGLKTLVRTIDRWLEAFIDWLDDLLPKGNFVQPGSDRDWRGAIKMVLYILSIFLITILLFLAWRWQKRRGITRKPTPGQIEVLPVDLSDERLTADDLPANQWLDMAADLLSGNDFHSALRALYLAILAILADHGRLVIARHKTNQDYYGELARRSHSEPEVLASFDWCRRVFESVWYGMHPIAGEQVAQFKRYQERIAGLVQSPS
jgi:hypothetical protein